MHGWGQVSGVGAQHGTSQRNFCPCWGAAPSVCKAPASAVHYRSCAFQTCQSSSYANVEVSNCRYTNRAGERFLVKKKHVFKQIQNRHDNTPLNCLFQYYHTSQQTCSKNVALPSYWRKRLVQKALSTSRVWHNKHWPPYNDVVSDCKAGTRAPAWNLCETDVTAWRHKRLMAFNVIMQILYQHLTDRCSWQQTTLCYILRAGSRGTQACKSQFQSLQVNCL